MANKLLRGALVCAAGCCVVTAGIALNLGILSEGPWGAGGLTLGASGGRGVRHTETTPSTATPTTRRGHPRPSSQPSVASTTTITIALPPVTPLSRKAPTQHHVEPTPPSSAPATSEPQSTTTTRKPSPATTTTIGNSAGPQTFRVATWISVDTKLYAGTIQATAHVRHGWEVDNATKSGKDITLHFNNGSTDITWRVWTTSGVLHTSSIRVQHDS